MQGAGNPAEMLQTVAYLLCVVTILVVQVFLMELDLLHAVEAQRVDLLKLYKNEERKTEVISKESVYFSEEMTVRVRVRGSDESWAVGSMGLFGFGAAALL